VIVPLWAYHEQNWWLLLGIVFASIIAPQLAQIRAGYVGIILLFVSIGLLLMRGIHFLATFLALSSLWSFAFFQLAEYIQRTSATRTLIDSAERFQSEVSSGNIRVYRDRESSPT
jgi:hypothetical protein